VRQCFTRVGHTSHSRCKLRNSGRICRYPRGMYIVLNLLPYCQFCSQFAPTWERERSGRRRGRLARATRGGQGRHRGDGPRRRQWPMTLIRCGGCRLGQAGGEIPDDDHPVSHASRGQLCTNLSLSDWPVRIGRGRRNERPLDRVRDLWGVREVKTDSASGRRRRSRRRWAQASLVRGGSPDIAEPNPVPLPARHRSRRPPRAASSRSRSGSRHA
jgi:hypothetical protein